MSDPVKTAPTLGTVYTSAQTSTATPSATMVEERSVGDKTRYLVRARSQLLGLVAHGEVVDGEYRRRKGLIAKRKVANTKYELKYKAPRDRVFPVTAASNGTTVVVTDSSSVIRPYYTLYNPANGTMARVYTNTAGTITYDSVGAAFSAAVGDKLILSATAYKQGSENPSVYQHGESFISNTLQIMRFSIEISRSVMTDRHVGGNDLVKRLQKDNIIDSNCLADFALLFGRKATSTNFNTATNAGDSFSSVEGLYHLAKNVWDAGGNMSAKDWRKKVPEALEYVSPSQNLIALTSQKAHGHMLDWIGDKLIVNANENGRYSTFGYMCEDFRTDGPTVTVISCDAFNFSGLEDKMLIFDPNDVEYAYKDGRDLAPTGKEIQGNSKDSVAFEVMGEIGILPACGGFNMLAISGIL